MVTMEKVRRVKKKYEADLMGMHGVVGVAIGYKHVDGKKTNQLCIICYVIDKKLESALEEHDIIPKEIEGVPVDVIESGRIRTL